MTRKHNSPFKDVDAPSKSASKREQQLHIQKSFTRVIKPSLQRRVHLIGQSIVGSFLAGNDPENVSFRHILNRVMLLIQVPFFFLIYEEKDGNYIEHYRSTKNPQDQEKINEFTRLIESVPRFDQEFGKKRNSLREKKKLINLFNSQYHLLPVLVSKSIDGYKLQSISKINKSPRTNTHLISYVLDAVFDMENYESYGSVLRTLLVDSIRECKDEEKNSETLSLANRKPEAKEEIRLEVSDKFDQFLLRNSNLFLEFPNNGYLDRMYSKISKNLGHITKFVRKGTPAEEPNPIPANYVIFLRDYGINNDYKRHVDLSAPSLTGYNYRTRIALCDRQKEDIRRYFKFLKEEKVRNLKDGKNRFDNYADGLRGVHKNENSNIYSLAHSLDEWFWNELLSEKEIDEKDEPRTDPIEKLIGILENYFGRETRSIADPVFDGITYFRRPFSDGGIYRCFPNKFDNKIKEIPYRTIDEVQFAEDSKIQPPILDDLKHLVVSYYWFQGMLPKKKENHELAIMLTPIEIGGSVWAVIGYFSQVYKVNDDDGDLASEQLHLASQEVSWNQCYHIYQDMNARLKKGLRQGILQCYKDLLAYFYTQSLSEKNDAIIFEGSQSDEEARARYLKWLNDRFSAISEFLPYDRITIDKIMDGIATPAQEASTERGVPLCIGNVIYTNFSDTKKLQIREKINRPKAGAYLTSAHSCSIVLGSNECFPAVLKKQQIGTFVNKRDIQEILTDAALHPFSISELISP